MYPILFEYNGFIVPAWHVLFMLAALGTGIVFLRFAEADGYESRSLRILYLLTYFGGYFGARAFNILVEEQQQRSFLSSFWVDLLTPGGMTFYGGFLGALVVGGLYVTFTGFPRKLRLVDLSLVCGFLGLSIGRIGCLLNGDDFGKVITDERWQFLAVRFPKVLDDLPRYPVQVMESLFALAIFAVGVTFWSKRWRKRGMRAGGLSLAAVSAYALFRFMIEFLRGDPRQFFAGYSVSQWVSGLLLLGVMIGLVSAAMTAFARKSAA